VMKGWKIMKPRVETTSGFPELAQHCVYGVERGVNLFPDLAERRRTTSVSGGFEPDPPTRRSHLGIIQESLTREDIAKVFTFAPVNTIFPDTKINNTTFGLSMR